MNKANNVLNLLEELLPKDKQVIDAFSNKKEAVGKLLITDGITLEKLGMGGEVVAEWKNGKVFITSSSSVKSDDMILRALKKAVPKFSFDTNSYNRYF